MDVYFAQATTLEFRFLQKGCREEHLDSEVEMVSEMERISLLTPKAKCPDVHRKFEWTFSTTFYNSYNLINKLLSKH